MKEWIPACPMLSCLKPPRDWSLPPPVGSESRAPCGRNSEMEIGTVRERLRDHYCSRRQQASDLEEGVWGFGFAELGQE